MKAIFRKQALLGLLVMLFSVLDSMANTSFVLPSGVSGNVAVIKQDGSGNIYIGGSFSSVNGLAVNNLAMWNGTIWSDMGGGVTGGSVTDIDFFNGEVYVAGSFTNAGGSSISRLARWNGSSWAAAGTFSAVVNCLSVTGGFLYAAGNFATINSTTVNNIGRFDGTTWSALANGPNIGTNSGINMMAHHTDGNIYVAGQSLTTAGGVSSNRIARWSGTTWSAMAGITNLVRTMSVDASGRVYIAENSIIRRWAGSSWTQLAEFVFGTPLAMGMDLANGRLYIGGQFTTVTPQGGSTLNATRACVYNISANTWSAISTGLNQAQSSNESILVAANNDVFFGGEFTIAGSNVINRLARWDGTSFSQVGPSAGSGNGVNGTVSTIVADGGDYYIAGSVSQAGAAVGSGVYFWDGAVWTRLGPIFNADVRALAMTSDGTLYAGGDFTDVGGDPNADFIVRWNGTAWIPLQSSAPNGPVTLLTAAGTNLYVFGFFTAIGATSFSRFAQWTGSSWLQMNNNVPGMGGGSVFNLAVQPTTGHLYAGGSFNGTPNATNLAWWNGTTWSGLGPTNNPTNFVNTLAFEPNGNILTGHAGVPTGAVRRWNGTSWSNVLSLPNGGNVNRIITISGGQMIVGGTMLSVNQNGTTGATITVNGLTQFNGSTWSAVHPVGFSGGGINEIVPAGTRLIVGGSFQQFNAVNTSRFAILESTLLPVQWGSFQVHQHASGHQLAWSTLQEQNTSHFEPQHSTDGANWNSLGKVAAAGNSQTRQHYNFTHATLAPGRHLYRILQIDKDGKRSYSAIRSIIRTAPEFKLASNTAQAGILQVLISQRSLVQIFANDGKLVWKSTLQPGMQQLQLQHLKPGQYRLVSGTQSAPFLIF